MIKQSFLNAASLAILLLGNGLGRTVEDGPSSWPCSREVAGSWLWHDSVLTIVPLIGATSEMEDLSLFKNILF